MKINIKATNTTLTPAISDYIEKKMGMLDKFFVGSEDALINIEVGKTTRHHKSGEIFKAEIHINSRGEDYYAVAEMDDLYAAIDGVKDLIQHELTSKRKRAARLFRKGGAKIKNLLKGAYDVGGASWKRIKNFRNRE